MMDLESLFNLSYGMCVVSSRKADKFNGCIVNTVFQLTPEPPTLAVSINRENLTWEYIRDSKVMCVSILDEETPMPYFARFGFRSGRDRDKFEGINYKTGVTGVPILLDNTVGFIEAEVTGSVDVETHTVFIARIVACETIDAGKIPMTYNYYRDVKHGRTPKTAATYVEKKELPRQTEGVKKMKKYKCTLCSYIYDPTAGDPDNGVAPGVAFEDLPDDWVCPECGADKDEFEPVEE